MFFSELSPVFQNLFQQPLAFTSGFVSGVLHLKLNEDPLASWLKQQGYNPSDFSSSNGNNSNNKPQSIEIE